MRQTWREKVNQVLSQMGQKIPMSRNCGRQWGEVELPDCLRAELEGFDNAKEK